MSASLEELKYSWISWGLKSSALANPNAKSLYPFVLNSKNSPGFEIDLKETKPLWYRLSPTVLSKSLKDVPAVLPKGRNSTLFSSILYVLVTSIAGLWVMRVSVGSFSGSVSPSESNVGSESPSDTSMISLSSGSFAVAVTEFRIPELSTSDWIIVYWAVYVSSSPGIKLPSPLSVASSVDLIFCSTKVSDNSCLKSPCKLYNESFKLRFVSGRLPVFSTRIV